VELRDHRPQIPGCVRRGSEILVHDADLDLGDLLAEPAEVRRRQRGEQTIAERID
jgi:hypothetical protein